MLSHFPYLSQNPIARRKIQNKTDFRKSQDAHFFSGNSPSDLPVSKNVVQKSPIGFLYSHRKPKAHGTAAIELPLFKNPEGAENSVFPLSYFAAHLRHPRHGNRNRCQDSRRNSRPRQCENDPFALCASKPESQAEMPCPFAFVARFLNCKKGREKLS